MGFFVLLAPVDCPVRYRTNATLGRNFAQYLISSTFEIGQAEI
jgi:hypothetical protein